MNLKLVLIFAACVASAYCASEDHTHAGKRVKRAKYYNSPPPYVRYYKRPPPPNLNVISYTPPPGYVADKEPSYPPHYKSRPPQVSKPTLGDDDINNIVKYLTKTDLDKIIEFANVKESDSDRYKVKDVTYDGRAEATFGREPPRAVHSDHYDRPTRPYHNYDTPGTAPDNDYKTNSVHDSDPSYDVRKEYYPETAEESRTSFSSVPLKKAQNTDQVEYTDDEMLPAVLPTPVNLRAEADEVEGSPAHNVPKVVKPNPGYNAENFGDLPLMEYLSKLDSVSSYNVPHYSITSPGGTSPPYTPTRGHAVEPAPPASAAQRQSDAHLKAIKVWVHHSNGKAYTLNRDGSLTIERPKSYKYGHK